MSWSMEQLQAIESRGSDILVAAAAGSGKTSVLVERILQRVQDNEMPLDMDRLLVVTFTNAAAAEMRGRIHQALSRALAESPGHNHLEKQLLLLNKAQISTIHAFCQSLVRQYFYRLNIPPDFRLVNEGEETLLLLDVLENLCGEKYEEDDEGFLELVEQYGNDRGDSGLYEVVLRLHEFSRSQPWPYRWLDNLAKPFVNAKVESFDQLPWVREIKEKIRRDVFGFQKRMALFSVEGEETGALAGYKDCIQQDVEALAGLVQTLQGSWDDWKLGIEGFSLADLRKAGKVEVDPEWKLLYQNCRNELKERLTEFRKFYFTRSSAELTDDLNQTGFQVERLACLVQEFSRRYQQEKISRGLLDFSDLEHYALDILTEENEEGTIIPSEVALELQEKYMEIMIDEYQDTNGVQEAIMTMVSRYGPGNRFMVGDVKQSIYRFRLAEPELFLEKAARYERPPTESPVGIRIDLARNFRSREEVVHGVNFLFQQWFTRHVTELDYDSGEQLYSGAHYPPMPEKNLTGPVEVYLLDKEGQEKTLQGDDAPPEENSEDTSDEEVGSFALECRLIARKIKGVMDDGVQVYDKDRNEYRRITWRDIVVLLRSVKGKTDVLLETLENYGIPAYGETGGGYFQETEIQVMLALLAVIDNPRQDIPLAAVLHSPIVGLTGEELACVRLADREGDLWDAVRVAVASLEENNIIQGKCLWECREAPWKCRLEKFFRELEKWRTMARSKGVPDLIWQIYRDTGYYDYVGGMPGGEVRQANLRVLHDRARQYETTNFRGLFRFLRFVEGMKDKGTDLSTARTLGESEDVVRVMSVHKSKGLEFPVVIVADVGKRMNLQDGRSTLLCHKTLGVGPYVWDKELNFRYPSLARQGIAQKMIMETKAEELRVIYVALTRAREKLIIVGTVRKLAERCKKWQESLPGGEIVLEESLLASAASWMDWLGPALIRHPDGAELRRYGESGKGPSICFLHDPSQWSIQIVQGEELVLPGEALSVQQNIWEMVKENQPLPATLAQEKVCRHLEWQYPYIETISIPAKMTVTELKGRLAEKEEESPAGQFLLKEAPKKIGETIWPRFLSERKKLTPVEFGTLMHMVMQHVTVGPEKNEFFVRQELDRMVKEELILPFQAAAVDVEAVVRFLQSALGERIRLAKNVWRELPFSMVIPGKELYEELGRDEENIFVQGVLDCLFQEDGGFVLVDYKTDRVTTHEEIINRYQFQMMLYARAVMTIWRQPVKEIYLYALQTGEAILMTEAFINK